MEEFGAYNSNSASINYQYFELNNNLRSLILIFEGFKNFFLTPFLKGNFSLFSMIIFFEMILIFAFLYARIKFELNFNLRIALKWLIVLFASYLFYSLFVFNDGTIYRYKVPILFFVIFGYFTNIKKIKS